MLRVITHHNEILCVKVNPHALPRHVFDLVFKQGGYVLYCESSLFTANETMTLYQCGIRNGDVVKIIL
jgi:hypothetical protein